MYRGQGIRVQGSVVKPPPPPYTPTPTKPSPPLAWHPSGLLLSAHVQQLPAFAPLCQSHPHQMPPHQRPLGSGQGSLVGGLACRQAGMPVLPKALNAGGRHVGLQTWYAILLPLHTMHQPPPYSPANCQATRQPQGQLQFVGQFQLQ